MMPNFDFGNNFFRFYSHLLTAPRSRKEVKFMQSFIKDYDSKILDFGFGWARHLKVFAELGYKDLTGIDSSEKLLEKAKNHLKKYPFVELVKSGFAEFTSNEKYDFIFQVFQSFGYDTRKYDQENLNNIKNLLSDEGLYLLDLRNPIKLSQAKVFDLPSSVRVKSQINNKKLIFKYESVPDRIMDKGEMNLYSRRYPRLKPWHFIHLSKSAEADFALNPVFLANEHML